MSNRRYRIGKYKVYDEYFDQYYTNSPILNSEIRENDATHRWIDPNTKSGLQSIEAAYFGNENGYYYLASTPYQAAFPAIEQALKAAQAEYERVKKRLIREGKSKDDVPEDVINKTLRIEAVYDVRMVEKAEIEKWINNFQETERKERNAKMLKEGPNGSAKLSRGVPEHIDYQRVDLTEDGIPIIVDEQSPYRGMAVSDYRKKIVKPWKEARAHLANEREKLRAKMEYKGFDKADIDKQWKARKKEIFKSWQIYKPLFSQKVKGKYVPEWPEGVPNYLAEETEKA